MYDEGAGTYERVLESFEGRRTFDSMPGVQVAVGIEHTSRHRIVEQIRLGNSFGAGAEWAK